MRKRVLSLLLAICLVVGLLPPTALAGSGTTIDPFKVTFGTLTWNAVDNTVYYASIASNTVTDHGTTAPADDAWNVKLDTTGAVPQLTLKNVSYNKALTIGTSKTDFINSDFNIVVEGTNTITNGSGHAMILYVAGKTTISSTTNGTLALKATSTSSYHGLWSHKGAVEFKNVNIVAEAKTYRNDGLGAAIFVEGGDLTIDGGSMTTVANHNSVIGLRSSGTLTIKNYAKVNVTTNNNNLYHQSSYGKATADGSKGAYYAKNLKNTTYNGVEGFKGNIDSPTYEVGGVTYTATSNVGDRDRYAILATTAIVIDKASVKLVDSSTAVTTLYSDGHIQGNQAEGATVVKTYYGNYEKLFNKTPTITNATIMSSANSDGSSAQAVDIADATAWANANENPFMQIDAICTSHTYTDGSDPDCNICGALRNVPKTITVRVTTGTSSSLVDITKEIAAGEVYYGVAGENGYVTSFDKAATAPEGWDFKVDNTDVVTKLVFNNAYLKQSGENKKPDGDGIGMINVSGQGALQIITETASTLDCGYGNVITTSMTGGTTYTSVNGSLLNVVQGGTGGLRNIMETVGSLTFKDANIYGSSRRQGAWSYHMVSGAGNVIVDGGTLTFEAINCAAEGIYAGGNLTLSNYANVRVLHTASPASSFSATETRPRHAVEVIGTITINDASLEIQDATGNWEIALNKMPTLSSNVTAKYSTSIDGSDPQTLAPADPTAIIEYPYIAFTFTCSGHEYDNAADTDCNKCGAVREVPKDISVTLAGNIIWNAKAGEVYYATTNANGAVTNLGALTEEPTDWNIKLDNTKVTAELTLKGATIKPGSVNSIAASGAGALKIIVDGDSSLESSAADALLLTMESGTTITSVNGSKLSSVSTSTSAWTGITVAAGSLTLHNANVYVSAKNQNGTWPKPAFNATGMDVTIVGGSLEVEGLNTGINGILVKNLTIKDYAKVNIINNGGKYNSLASAAITNKRAYGVNATGDFVINNASLKVINKSTGTSAGSWLYAVNKMPTIEGDVLAQYSTSENGSALQDLNPTDATANVVYPYVAFTYNCLIHDYTNETDPDCNKCGEVRDVPRDITVIFGNYVRETVDQEVVWNAAVGEIYYATTNANGVITNLGALTTEPAEWNIKLDNTQTPAVLTLKNATLMKDTDKGYSASHNAIKAVGEGKLKIVVDGDSTITSGYNNVIDTDMAGGTTYTSLNNSLLSLLQNGTSSVTVIAEKRGTLTFENANILAKGSRHASEWEFAVINAASDMNVISSKLDIFAENASPTSKIAYGVSGIDVGGVLTLSDYSIVNVQQKAIGADGFTGVTNRPTDPQYRHGVHAADIYINDSSLYIIDNAENMFEYAINKMPVLSNTVSAHYSTNVDGSNLQALTAQNATAFNKGPDAGFEFPYVAFALICNDHVYDNETDPDCNKCGATREVPRTITVRVTTGKQGGPLVDLTKTIYAGEIYYGIADETGLVTSFEKADTAPEGWDFKVDNTKPVAELVFNNAYLKQSGEVRGADGDGIGMFNISGEGALKVIVESASTLECGYGEVFETAMAGGTTYTSVDNSLFTVLQSGTGGYHNFKETVGSLTFVNANIYGSSKRQGAWSYHMITGAGDVFIDGSTITMEAINCAVEGIYAGGNLLINNYSKVNLLHSVSAANTFTATEARPRHAVEAAGTIAIENASLRIQDISGKWDIALNKMPVLSNVNAEYSESADGIGASVLNPTDPTAKIEYPYVGFIFNCTNHEYDNITDFDCNKCGAVREVVRSLTVIFGNRIKDVVDQEIVWNVAANEIYYAKTNAEGIITSLGALTAEPAEWNIKLDNTQATAVLTLKNANIMKYGDSGYGGSHDAVKISGEGKLKIVIAADSTIISEYNNPITTDMAGGTTITSVNNALLIANQYGTSGINAIKESKGNLTFDHANVLAINSRSAEVWNYPAISAAGDITVIGGKLDVRVQDKGRAAFGATGISAGGTLALSEYALVRVQNLSTGPDQFAGGIDKRPTSPQYRYGVKAGKDIIINNSTLSISDNVNDMFEYAINKMPTLVGDVAAYYSVDTDGSNLQTLTAQNTTEFAYGPAAAIEFPYVIFGLICNNHEYDNNADAECNKCGAIRDVIKDVTIQIVTDDKETRTTPLAPEYNRIVTIAPGEVYYGITNANGYVTEFVKQTSEPAEWNIKLDNTKAIAELVFKGAYLYKNGTYRDDSGILNLLTVSGEGKLKVITQTDSTFESFYGNVIETKMVGGTTYTSVNNALLTLKQTGTSGISAIVESVGNLTFENANIYTNSKRQGTYKHPIISAAGNMNVVGGNLTVEAINCSTQGIVVGGNLNLTDYASVRMINEKTNVSDYKPETYGKRYAVKVSGDININNASLRISDLMGHWDAAVNKAPKLTNVVAKYSEKADGSNLQALSLADPAASIEYAYVEFVVECAEHIWDNATDATCNRCGAIRAIPYGIQVAFQYGLTEVETLAWDAKVGEIYYATTTTDGFVVDLGKLSSEPEKWNIKLDNTGAEAVLTFNGATISRKKRPTSANNVFDIKYGSLGTITIKGAGALRVVTEKASTINSNEAYGSFVSYMDGGTTFESKNNAKLTLATTSSATTGGIQEQVGNLTFENANVSVQIKKTHQNYVSTTVTTPRNMTVIGGKVEITAGGYANAALNVKGDLTVKDNGILLVTTGSKCGGGSCKQTPYGMNVGGEITVNGATLMVKNYGKYWGYMLNKMPTLEGGVAAYCSMTSTKESKLEAFTLEAGSNMTELEEDAIFYYFSTAKPGTLEDSTSGAEGEEDEDDDFLFEDFDNPFTGDTTNLTLMFVLVMTSAAALVVLFSKKKALRE